MDKNTFDNYKVRFKNTTGKNADENLEAYMGFLNLIFLMDARKFTLDIYQLLISELNDIKAIITSPKENK